MGGLGGLVGGWCCVASRYAGLSCRLRDKSPMAWALGDQMKESKEEWKEGVIIYTAIVYNKHRQTNKEIVAKRNIDGNTRQGIKQIKKL